MDNTDRGRLVRHLIVEGTQYDQLVRLLKSCCKLVSLKISFETLISAHSSKSGCGTIASAVPMTLQCLDLNLDARVHWQPAEDLEHLFSPFSTIRELKLRGYLSGKAVGAMGAAIGSKLETLCLASINRSLFDVGKNDVDKLAAVFSDFQTLKHLVLDGSAALPLTAMPHLPRSLEGLTIRDDEPVCSLEVIKLLANTDFLPGLKRAPSFEFSDCDKLTVHFIFSDDGLVAPFQPEVEALIEAAEQALRQRASYSEDPQAVAGLYKLSDFFCRDVEESAEMFLQWGLGRSGHGNDLGEGAEGADNAEDEFDNEED